MGRRRPPEVRAQAAKPHQKYWLANGVEVRPLKWDNTAKVVLCSKEISPGHRKRDFPVEYDTILYTKPPSKPEINLESSTTGTNSLSLARLPRETEYTIPLSTPPADEEEQVEVPTSGAPLPPVRRGAPPLDALRRLSALSALRDAINAALDENSHSKWRHFLIAHHLNPELRCMKHALAQAELDMLAVANGDKVIRDEIKNI